MTKKSRVMKMKLKTRRAWTGAAFAAPATLGAAVFYLVPYLISVFYSLTVRGKFVGLQNFFSLFSSDTFLLSMKNTAVFSAFAIPLSVVIPFFIALFLASFDKYTDFFSSLFLSPLIVPIASVVYVWKIIFSDFGIINGILNRFGLGTVHFFKGGWAMAVVILIFVWKNCAYNIILFSAGIRKIPKEALESARLDGASNMQVITRIVIPLLTPTTFFVVLLTVISSFKIYREIYLLFGQYPDESVYMIQHFMNNNFQNLNYPRLSSASIVLSVFIIAAMLVFFRLEKRSAEG